MTIINISQSSSSSNAALLSVRILIVKTSFRGNGMKMMSTSFSKKLSSCQIELAN